ncbi:unnamed protein product [Sphagnum troendelagicum]|uniref:Uncharacterized protein n=1 Tax=Sphagnum troendelagicum TaxID=128251 RepID=A0ABP0U1H6_9BRYO
MSRCYPYPPPGYEKEAHKLTDLAPPITKKERHKHKDKKKKKKKEKEKEKEKAGDLNGEAHDSLRSSKLQRTGLVNDLLHEDKQNGRVQSESYPSAAVERPLGKGENGDGGEGPPLGLTERTPTNSPHLLYDTKEGPNGNAVAKPLLVLPLKRSSSIPSRPSREPSIQLHSLDSSDIVSQRQQEAANLPTTSASETLPLMQTSIWSETADEDWLFVRRPLKTHSKPKAEVDTEEPAQVWAKAIYLPAVDIYALPYVVPY